jgi:integrase
VKKLQKLKIKTLAPKTTNGIIDLFSTIFNYAISQEIYKGENYISKVKRLKVNNTRERYLNEQEIIKLMDAVRDDELLYLFVLLSLSCGGRIATTLNIKVKIS